MFKSLRNFKINKNDSYYKQCLDKLIISHNGAFYYIWYPLMIFLCTTTSLLYIKCIAFRSIHTMASWLIKYIESIFLIDFILNFFVDYQPPGEYKIVRKFSLIINKYWEGEMLWDLVPLLPLHLIQLRNSKY